MGLLILSGSWYVFEPAARAQTTSTIEGHVLDNQELVVPGASVRLTNDLLGIDRRTQSDSAGLYRFSGLLPGVYAIAAEKSGFTQQSYTGLQLTVNRDLIFNVILRVGSVTEKVDVSASAPLIDTNSSSTGATVTPRQIEDMPLNGRNYLDLMQLVPGIELNHQADPTSDDAVPILGERGGNAVFLIDGMPNRDDVNGGPAAQFNQESILEFQVVTSGYKNLAADQAALST